MMIEKSNVCCILVTFNRSKCLINELNAIIQQSIKVKDIVIVNNNSTDDTIAKLIENEFLDKSFNENSKKDLWHRTSKNGVDIHFLNSSKNNGGGSGFKMGIEHALTNLKPDFFWIMDDDVLPQPNCLFELLKSIDEKHRVSVPKRVGENFNDDIIKKIDFKNPFAHLFYNSRKIYKKTSNKIKIETPVFTFEGPLIDANIVRKIGVPCDDYFLQGDDYDYALRAGKYTKIYYVFSAIMNRQLPFVNKKPEYWRLYYSIRSLALLEKKFCSSKIVSSIRIFNLKTRWILISLKHRDIIERKIVKKAIYDAKNNILGKTIDSKTNLDKLY